MLSHVPGRTALQAALVAISVAAGANPSAAAKITACTKIVSAFRNNYALKASTTFSKGAHDEWNIVRVLNERRRAHDRFGIANQLVVLFDGGGIAPSSAEAATSDGYTGKCLN